ncbi:hypothetical protein DL93DRAFT_2229119 [Clavulina sp. PMI_390]|nr:hypothetical protein DL93DRAFT_2229119 [Clavulina sp. PMI_390]
MRFTLHIYRSYRSDMVEQLACLINNPHIARYTFILRVLILEPALESELGIAQPSSGSAATGDPSTVSRSTIPSMIRAAFLLLDNVKDLTIVQVDRRSLPRYLPQLSAHLSLYTVSDQEHVKAFQVGEPLAQTVLNALEDWPLRSTLHKFRTVNVSFEALAHLIKDLPSVHSLSVLPPVSEALIWRDPQPLDLPALRSLRTSVRWAQVFLSSTSPTHSLVLINTEPHGGNSILGRLLRELSSPAVRAVQ